MREHSLMPRSNVFASWNTSNLVRWSISLALALWLRLTQQTGCQTSNITNGLKEKWVWLGWGERGSSVVRRLVQLRQVTWRQTLSGKEVQILKEVIPDDWMLQKHNLGLRQGRKAHPWGDSMTEAGNPEDWIEFCSTGEYVALLSFWRSRYQQRY
jgi:hypothetical protein